MCRAPTAARPFVDQLAAGQPTVAAGWVDGGYKAGFPRHAADTGIAFQVVVKQEDQKGDFAPTNLAERGNKAR